MRCFCSLPITLSILLLAGENLPAATSADADAAIKRVEALSGKIERDDDKIVGVNLLDRSATDANVELLTALGDLRQLALWGAEITDKGVARLDAFPNLTALTLENTQLTDAGLKTLEKLPKLKSLNLRRNTSMTDAGLAHVKKLPNLELLSLLYNNITDDGLAELKDLKKIKMLDVRGCVQIDDDGLAHLKGLTSLKSLKLRNTAVTDAGLAHLEGLTRLIALSIEDAQITDDGLKVVEKLPNLEELSVFRCYNVSDDLFDSLAGAARLKQLAVRDTPVTGAGLARSRPRIISKSSTSAKPGPTTTPCGSSPLSPISNGSTSGTRTSPTRDSCIFPRSKNSNT